ncbi:MAG: penicillin-binding protein activator LpoB [Elusimicrobiota bacterium]
MKKINLFLFAILFLLCGCSGKDIIRLSSNTTIDLSGRWNDTDSQQVSQAVIEHMLASDWYEIFKHKYSREPVVITGKVHNKSYEHIDVETFVKDLERAMINSGKIDLVASKAEREEVRQERSEMQKWASVKTRKEPGEETGADYMLKGTLNSILDEEGGKKVVFYQVDLNLINLENNNIIWSGQKKIKKFIKKPIFKF